MIFVSLFALLFIGVPISFSLGLASVIAVIASGFPPIVVVQRMFTGADSIALTAIPLFILAGELMLRGGMSRRLVNFADALMGHFPSGLAMVSILACMFFAAITGSAIAATAAIGGIMIPLMTEKKYEPTFSAPLLACSGTIGAVIPPSIPLLVFGVLANVSVGDLFIAGFVPGVMMGLSLMVLSFFTGKKRNYIGREKRAPLSEIARTGADALLAMLMPILIIGGIMSGWFTPTESGTIAVAFSIVVGMFVYRELKIKDIFQILVNSAKTTGQVLIVVALASLFTWVLAVNQIPQQIGAFLSGNINSAVALLLVINIILLVIGAFIDTVSALVIFAPLFIPLVQAFDIDLIHFGLVMVVNVAIGMCVPPVGVCLFVSGSIAKVSLMQQMKDLLPMLAVLLVVLLIITYIPQTVTFLPNLVRGSP